MSRKSFKVRRFKYRPVHLEAGGGSRPYHQISDKSWSNLEVWLSETLGNQSFDWLNDIEETQQLLREYIEYLHKKDPKGVWHGRHGLTAVQWRYQTLKGKIPRPWNCIKSWQVEIPWKSRVASPFPVLQAMFGAGVDWALEDPRVMLMMIPCVLLCRLAFFCVLRVGEMLKLSASDLSFPDLAGEYPVMVARLLDPKNKFHYGRSQFSTCRDRGIIKWIQWWIGIWPGSATSFRRCFRRLLRRLRFPDDHYKASSLRPGGATHFHLLNYPTLRIAELGRWANEQNLRIYLQEAMASASWNDLETSVRAHVTTVAQEAAFAWKQAPKLPWHLLNISLSKSRR